MAVPATVSYNVVQMPGSGDWDWVNEERKHEVLQELRIFLVSDGSLLNLKLPISKWSMKFIHFILEFQPWSCCLFVQQTNCLDDENIFPALPNLSLSILVAFSKCSAL